MSPAEGLPRAAEAAPPAPLPESETILAVCGGAERKGPWEPPEHLRVIAVCGGARLDFREADLLEGVTEIDVFAFWGGVEILAPDDVHVDARGHGVLGGFTHCRHDAGVHDAPCLRIRGTAVMGGVETKIR